MAETILKLTSIKKVFNGATVVDDLNLSVEDGEIFTLLGPSGCGKSTTLRMVAGLENPDEGEIVYNNRTLVSVSRRHFEDPFNRNMGMVFQSYGIWPHMTVFENVAYPLRIRKVDQATINDRVGKALELVGLESFHDRPAPMLSGGQQQRVAIARALVYRPKILLLDEPFSNLDAKLREHMRMELRELQRQLGVTILFVTHDQIEALTLSDRMAVMNRGKCEQLGTPRELYENPRTSFVQDFLGQTIAFDVIVAGRDDRGKVACTLDGTNHHVSLPIRPETPVSQGDRALFVFRPEYIQVFANGSAAHVTPQAGAYDAVFDATIKTLLFMGDRYEARIVVGSQEAIIYLPKDKEWTEGLPVRIALAHGKGRLWPK